MDFPGSVTRSSWPALGRAAQQGKQDGRVRNLVPVVWLLLLVVITGGLVWKPSWLVLRLSEYKPLAQMAQFSTVSGLQELNDRFDTLAASISGDQALQAASLIGREILVSGDVVSLDAEGQSVDLAVVTQGAGEVIVDVKDDSGQLVRTLSLQADAAGNQRLSWDGQNTKGEPVAAGLYQFEARMNGGDAIGVLLAGRVDSVGLGGSDGTRLRTEQLGEVSMSAVRALY